MTNFSDKDFIARFRKRDSAAIAEAVDAYLPHILNAARAVGLDEATAQDVVQDTFLVFIERASQFEGRSHIRTWLFGIFYRKVSESRRGLEKVRRHDDIEEVMARRFAPNGSWSQPPQPLSVYGTELNRHVEACLDGVPPVQRMAFVLREIEELDSAAICKILNVSRTHLSVLFFRARNRIRECLESRGAV